MATPEFLIAVGRPSSPVTTSWFEFLLKPDLLLKHLSNPYAVPGSHQLINQFMQQANALEKETQFASNNSTNSTGDTKHSENTKEQLQNQNQNVNLNVNVTKEEANHIANANGIGMKNGESQIDNEFRRKKIHALKILALKTAAYGGWNLDSLMNSIPGPLVLQLLQELMILAYGKLEHDDEILIETLTQESHSDHAFFSLLLYQRWCVQTVLQDCLPRKPVKINSIPVPGLTEPVIQMVGITEEKLARIKKLFGKCKSTLSESLDMKRRACIPTQECFDFSGGAMLDLKLNWEKGDYRGVDFWGRQIAFDLGAVYFYETDYYKALDMFIKVESWTRTAQSVNDIDMPALTGYLKACKALVHGEKYDDNVVNKFNKAIISKDLRALADLLEADLHNRTLPLTAGDHTDLLIHQLRDETPDSFTDLHLRLDCLCCVTYILRGEPYYFYNTTNLAMIPQRNEFLIDNISKAIESSSATEKKNISEYLSHLLNANGEPMKALLAKREPIRKLLGSTLAREQQCKMDTSSLAAPSLLDCQGYDTIETTLALTYNPEKVWNVLCGLPSPAGLKPAVDFWKLPKDLDRLFNELKMDLNSVCAYILIAKAKELIAIQEHNQAVNLLNAADKTIREISGKIVKIVRWEVLYSNLLSTKGNDGKPAIVDLDKKVKSCLYALKVDSDIYPHENLVMECVSHLLLSKDWEYLSSLHDTRVAFTEYARQLINVCKELPAVQSARAPGKVLWDTSIIIFSLQNIGKRVRLGNQAMLPKDTYKRFILTINEPLVLSVLISLLTKIYNLKNTDIDIDRTNNFSSVWPESISPALLSSLDEVYIRELMLQVVQHALSINSLQSTWLKTYAEIQYAVGNQKDAMKYYLQAASVASNHFMQPIPFYMFDNEVYTRLVKCCVQLKHFTQAAVLSQFFDEPDYIVAFKYLQEKNCQDGMDLYYDCLWDVNLIEFLTSLHGKRGELDKRQQLIQLMGNPELNSNNPETLLQTFKSRKKAQFFRLIYRQY